jgi:hypothetical protein
MQKLGYCMKLSFIPILADSTAYINTRSPVRFFFFGTTAPILGLGLPPWSSPFHFGFLDHRQSVGLLGRVISSSHGLYLYTGQHNHRKTHARTHTHQTSIPCVGFEPTIPASERAKTMHALDRSGTVTGPVKNTSLKVVFHIPNHAKCDLVTVV